MPRKNTTTKKETKSNNVGYRKIDDVNVTVEDVEFKITHAMYFTETDTYTFSLELDGINFYELRIVEGQCGKFISFPAKKGSDGKYYKYYYINFTEEEASAIIEAVTGSKD